MSGYIGFVRKHVKTNKVHSCSWCGEEIADGSYVPYREYMFDGQFCKDWMHEECKEAMLSLNWRDLEDGWTLGIYKRGRAEYK